MTVHILLEGLVYLPSSDAMSEADTLIMIGTSFPYVEYLPKPGQARGIQVDIKPEKLV
jgi:pyruvate dehydrogenase (quinone)